MGAREGNGSGPSQARCGHCRLFLSDVRIEWAEHFRKLITGSVSKRSWCTHSRVPSYKPIKSFTLSHHLTESDTKEHGQLCKICPLFTSKTRSKLRKTKKYTRVHAITSPAATILTQKDAPEHLYAKHTLFLHREYCDYLNVANLGWACRQSLKKKITSLLKNVFIALSNQFLQ